jgi:putative transposase
MSSTITIEYKLKGKQEQFEASDQAICTTQYLRNVAIGRWRKERGWGFSKIQELSKILANDANAPWVKNLNSTARQAALGRAWASIKRFYDRCQLKIQGLLKGKVGYPQFKYNVRSVEYKKSGWKIDPKTHRITFTDGNNIGTFKLLGQHDLNHYFLENIKRVRIVKKADGYYCQLVMGNICRIKLRTMTGQIRGIDAGISSYYVDDTGKEVSNSKYLLKHQKQLAKAQRQHSRKQRLTCELTGKKRNSHRRERSRIRVAKLHQKVSRQRKQNAWEQASKLFISNDIVGYEDFDISELVKNNPLAKWIYDAAWGELRKCLKYYDSICPRFTAKAVPSPYSTKECSRCHGLNDLELSDRIYQCKHCGLVLPRDHNSAIIIKQRLLKQLGIEEKEYMVPRDNREPEPSKGSKRLEDLEPLHLVTHCPEMKSSEDESRNPRL